MSKSGWEQQERRWKTVSFLSSKRFYDLSASSFCVLRWFERIKLKTRSLSATS